MKEYEKTNLKLLILIQGTLFAIALLCSAIIMIMLCFITNFRLFTIVSYIALGVLMFYYSIKLKTAQAKAFKEIDSK
jgi:hypothetical protein